MPKLSNLPPREFHRPHVSRHDSVFVEHPSQAKAGITPFPDRLYVVTALFNPLRFRSRYEHYRSFEKHCQDAGAILITVEVAFGDRPFECTEPEDPFDIQLRTWSEIWHKERMLNIGIGRLSDLFPDWKKVAWIDADVKFSRADWANETLQQLEHYMLVQMFSHAQDLSPDYAPLMHSPKSGAQDISVAGIYQSYMYSYVNGHPPVINAGSYYVGGWPGKPLAYWHPGFAWAARREAIDHLGGLFDTSIAGNGDHLMAAALVGKATEALPKHIGASFANELLEWQARAERYIQRDVGYVEGLLLHYWHGRKKDRKYIDRWQLLISEQFDPKYDLKPDSHGLWQLTDRNWKLRDKLRLYMRARLEDSTDVE